MTAKIERYRNAIEETTKIHYIEGMKTTFAFD